MILRADNSAGCFSREEDVASIALLAGIPRRLCWRDVSASPSRAGIWTRPFAPLSFDRLFNCRPPAELSEKILRFRFQDERRPALGRRRGSSRRCPDVVPGHGQPADPFNSNGNTTESMGIAKPMLRPLPTALAHCHPRPGPPGRGRPGHPPRAYTSSGGKKSLGAKELIHVLTALLSYNNSKDLWRRRRYFSTDRMPC